MSSVPKLAPNTADHAHPETETCPLCEQPIAGEHRAEIWGRIRAKERAQQEAAEAERRRQITEAVKTATDTQAQKHNHTVGQLRQQLKQKDEDAEKREERARKETLAQARQQHETELKKEQEKHAATEQKNKELTGQIKQLEEGRDKEVEQAVARETVKIREILAKDKDDALNKKDAKHFEEKQKLQSRLQEVQRQLEKERADHLGDGQEIDLFNELKEAFPHDKIERIAKGEPGADIRHEILHNGKVCGAILYESKNRLRWSKTYPAKLRRDQMAAKADHAILAAIKFPAGTRDITLFDNVLVVNPRHVVTLARLLRETTLSMHKLRLSGGQRSRKRDQIYKFITSRRCVQLLTRQEEVTEALVALDKKELKQHEKIWSERGTMLKQLEKAQADFRNEIDFIVEG